MKENLNSQPTDTNPDIFVAREGAEGEKPVLGGGRSLGREGVRSFATPPLRVRSEFVIVGGDGKKSAAVVDISPGTTSQWQIEAIQPDGYLDC